MGRVGSQRRLAFPLLSAIDELSDPPAGFALAMRPDCAVRASSRCRRSQPNRLDRARRRNAIRRAPIGLSGSTPLALPLMSSRTVMPRFTRRGKLWEPRTRITVARLLAEASATRGGSKHFERSGAQLFGRACGHLAVTIDRDDLAWERTRLAKETAERATPVRRADDRLRVRVTLHAISLAFSLVEEGCERVPSELLLVAFSRHGPSGESVAPPPSSSQFRGAVAPVPPRPVSAPAGPARTIPPRCRASACTPNRRSAPQGRAGVARESRRPRTSASQAHPVRPRRWSRRLIRNSRSAGAFSPRRTCPRPRNLRSAAVRP